MSKFIKKKKKKLSRRTKIPNLDRKVLQYFQSKLNKPQTIKHIFKGLDVVDKDNRNQVLKIVQNLLAEQFIKEKGHGAYVLAKPLETISGTIEVNQSGNGFFLMDNGDDIFVSKKNTNKALNKDLVELQLLPNKEGNRQEGQVVSILERSRATYMGIVQKTGKNAFVVTQKVGKDFFVSDKNLKQAKNGDRVVLKMLNWPNDTKNPFGEVIEVLGQAGDHETEIQGILGDFGLPLHFPAKVEKEAKRFTEDLTPEDLKTRRDFRSVTTFTIDPHDAKDFDDAISIEKLEDDLWEVGIHIADVSYYLDKSPILDAEAQERATSIYLVDRVIPMLPEYLSNGLCSLRPDETKRCFSVSVKINKRGTVKDIWIGRTLIHSDRRFTYEEAQEIIETKEGDYKDEIILLDSIAKKLRAKRMKQGAIAFDREEMRFQLDEKNNPIGVYMKRSLDAHKLVEEFMLLANRTVGESIGKVKAKRDQRTFVYRIHDKPDLEKLQNFTDFVNKIGFSFSWEEHTINKNLNEVLTEAHKSPFADVVETLAMRSMSKAVYSTNNIGHYGLGFGFYSHFTSPIRRYPDVMAHRLIQRYLDGGASANAEKYESLCKHSSSMEKLAVDAERASVKFMQVKFMEDKVGQTFNAVVNGITENGIYAEIKDMKCEGMIRLSSIRSDYFTAFPKDFLVKGSKGRVIRFGDEIKIQVTNTDLFKKQIDMVLVE